MNKLIDSHIHFNTKVLNIADDLFCQIKDLYGFVLILNTSDEKKIYKKNYKLFLNNFSNYKVAISLGYRNIEEDLKYIEFIQNIHGYSIIKIHPRLSKISIDQVKNIIELLKTIKFENIIVDGFYYGSNLKHHVNLECLIDIAKTFPDKKITFAHSGGIKVLETMLFARDLKNVYFDISLTPNYLRSSSVWNDLIHFLKFNGNRIMFGTDYPDFTVQQSLNTINELFEVAQISEEIRQCIYWKTASMVYDFK